MQLKGELEVEGNVELYDEMHRGKEGSFSEQSQAAGGASQYTRTQLEHLDRLIEQRAKEITELTKEVKSLGLAGLSQDRELGKRLQEEERMILEQERQDREIAKERVLKQQKVRAVQAMEQRKRETDDWLNMKMTQEYPASKGGIDMTKMSGPDGLRTYRAKMLVEERNRDLDYRDTLALDFDPIEDRSPLLKSTPRGGMNEPGVSVFPLRIEGKTAVYVPWAHRDLETIINLLPSLRDGAGPWIGALEKETQGTRLAVGDIKALLAKITSLREMEDVLWSAGMGQSVVSSDFDGQALDCYRGRLCGALRTEFPVKFDSTKLTPTALGQEDCALWIAKNMQTWRGQGLRKDPTDPRDFETRLFRKELLDALPVSVQNKLSDTPGLNAMPDSQWVETLKHHASKHQRHERDLEQQAKETERKLAQVSLEEKKRNKDISKVPRGTYVAGWAGS
nr:uncharacterized protein LOC129450891 [Misgurnus anguillicaudatus]